MSTESQKANNENFGPYWTEVLPGRLWSHGCALARTPPMSKYLRLGAPILDVKRCDQCGARIDDPYNIMSAADIRTSTRFGSLWCSSCVKESKERVKKKVPAPAIPARCNCGFFLRDCLIWTNPTCPGWDARYDRERKSPQGEGWTLWTLNVTIPEAKVIALPVNGKGTQGKLF